MMKIPKAWQVQSDQALNEASIVLHEADAPENIEEALDLAHAWMELADQWRQRRKVELSSKRSKRSRREQ